MTTQNGHCEHCDSDCLGGKVVKRTFGQTVQFQWHGTWGVRWDYECPFCEGAKAERERIVAWLRGAAIYDAADFIARGAHMEES